MTLPPDPAAADCEKLQTAQGFIFDIDGTLALADAASKNYRPLPGAEDFLRLLRRMDLPFVALTNGSAHTPEHYLQLLQTAGLDLRPGEVMTPVSIAIEALKRHHHERILVLGGEGVWRPLRDAGFEVYLPQPNVPAVEAVLVGWYPDFGMGALHKACTAVWEGADLYVTSAAAFFASSSGRSIGISNAIAAMITSTTQKSAENVGKPSALAMQTACSRIGLTPAEVAVVGDDPDLEVLMARTAGAFSAGVLTGLSGRADFAQRPEHLRPHLVVDDLKDLMRLYQSL